MNELIIEQKVREMILYGYIALRQRYKAGWRTQVMQIRTD